ncbi:Uncharacterized protein, contains caspase domain [Litoreibacter ascidiaceicola]|uniref:Uncharacterized protein, contains caspase domain n=1 Tax=Litoreibacter ascidiaceicola TaxID=1486859 RepID=A0A1M4W864_9RHOB|nr:caspase family protein [Litoreibacter ascidiaceicola]SHE77387.1 Uncharacterized protein, contains caspase domain [Litoreibacter ascidiaceicola]
MRTGVTQFARHFTRALRRVRLLAVLALALLLSSQAQAQDGSAEKRIALIIGNAAYKNVAELKNPRNDSQDMAAALKQVGFEVLLHTDLTQGTMLDTLRGFRRRASEADVALIYFAGHGIEIDRVNYLLPVDAVLETDSDINFEAVKLETMIFAASGADQLSMVIVDACRNNPFAASMKRNNPNRSIGRGLTAVEPSKNTLVAYAAKEGTTAADGKGRNSPYADALISSLKTPKLEVGLMMRQVRDKVLASTGGQQEPFVYGSLSADEIYLNDPDGGNATQPAFVIMEDVVEDVPDTSAAEIVFWKSISDQHAVEELQTYLQKYPEGFFAELARARIARAGGEVLTPEEPQVRLQPKAQEIDRALTRDEIVELQERLSALGHSLGRADGVAGRKTKAAIRVFEREEALPVRGQPTLSLITALRARIGEEELAIWRNTQASRVTPPKPAATRTKTKAKTPVRTRPKPVAAAPKAAQPAPAPAPKVVQPAPAPAPAQTKVSKPAAKYKQFCAANRQCATRTCRRGSQGNFFSNARNCKFCDLYVQRCQ